MLKNFFALRFNPTKETWLALGAGAVVILLSVLMNYTHEFLSVFLRDILMIAGIGVFFVLWRIPPGALKAYGLSFDQWQRNFLINIILAVALISLMVPGLLAQGKAFAPLNAATLSKVLFIMIAGVFEVLFFYTYLRVQFERAFGKMPAIILCAAFYSLHHAGFQPEYIKLFFVGISFVLVVCLTNSVWSIFPFYWAVGALLDVLVQSEVVMPIQNSFMRSIIMLVLIGIAFVIYRARKDRYENLNRSYARQ